MKKISMKLSAAERDTAGYMATAAYEAPRYPWGLSLNLGNDELEKLGITSLPAVGTTLELEASVTVSSLSAQEGVEGTTRSLTLQITDLCLCAPDEDAAAEVLFGKR